MHIVGSVFWWNPLARVAQWLESGVNSAVLTQEEADLMLNALRTNRLGTLTAVDEAGNVIRLRQPGLTPREGLPPLSAENPKIVIRPEASSSE